MLTPVVTLDARLSAAQAKDLLGRAPSAAEVVVRAESGGGDWWYAVWLDELRRVLDRAEPGHALGYVLGLAMRAPSPTRQITDADVRSEVWDGIVLDGRRAVGIGVRTARLTRGDIFGPPVGGAGGYPAGSGGQQEQQQQQQQQEQRQQQEQQPQDGGYDGGGAGPAPRPQYDGGGAGFAPRPQYDGGYDGGGAGFAPRPQDNGGYDGGGAGFAPRPQNGGGDPQTHPSPPQGWGPPPPAPSWGPPPAPAPPPPAAGGDRAPEPIPAYARLEAPAVVPPQQRFDIRIGLGTAAAPGAPPVPFLLQAGPGPTIELTVQVSADGFDTPEGIRRTLVVPKGDLSAGSVTVPLVAPPIGPGGVFWGVVEVQYALAGVLVGKAWQGIAVSAAPPYAPNPTPLGGTAVAVEAQLAADLTVTITEGSGPGRYVWVFTTPHPVATPGGQVTTTLRAGSARDFALEQVKNANAADGDRLALNQIKGIARTVAAAAPVEFWQVLGAVWQQTRAAGRTPSLLLVSDDPYIPWELASVEADYVLDRSLVDPTLAPVLGAHVRIGRWLPAGQRTPSGLSRPALPPTADVDLSRMAVVVGDYRAETGIRPLPHAKEEGTALSDRYQAIWLGGTRDEVGRVLSGQLTERGDPVAVQVLHLACHGEVDPQNPQYNGIVLSDSALRLDATLVRGGELGQAGAPLVFLNACQLASTTGELLGDYGGLAGAFLLEGCRGFIAPLWSVDDVLAKEVALDFYRLTVDEGVTAGEAWRRIRGRFGAAGDASQTTPLAYVYFGHPDLQITRNGTR